MSFEENEMFTRVEGHRAEHRANSSGEVMHWRVPMDDMRTMHLTVEFGAFVDGKLTAKMMEDQSEEGIHETLDGVYRWAIE